MRPLPLLLMLAACGDVPPLTVARLATLSPIEVDPTAISVGLDLPPGVAVEGDAARLLLGAVRDDTGARTSATAALVADEAGRWRVAPGDVAALRAVQATIRDWKAEAPDATEGTLAVTLEGCRLGDGPGQDAVVSVDLATAPGARPLPLLRGAPLEAVLEGIGAAALPDCGR